MTTIPATVGAPYEIDLTPRGLIRLSRTVNGRTHHLVFSSADAIAVADALVDTAEQLESVPNAI
ncbi:hypothetical protein ABQE57_07990 [Mycolicibacterium elephantis]